MRQGKSFLIKLLPNCLHTTTRGCFYMIIFWLKCFTLPHDLRIHCMLFVNLHSCLVSEISLFEFIVTMSFKPVWRRGSISFITRHFSRFALIKLDSSNFLCLLDGWSFKSKWWYFEHIILSMIMLWVIHLLFFPTLPSFHLALAYFQEEKRRQNHQWMS